MNDDHFGRDLAVRLGRLVEDEPPFVTDLSEALEAAERGGRQRQVRTRAVRGGGVLLAVAASAVLFTAVNQLTTDRAVAPLVNQITQEPTPPAFTPPVTAPTPTAPPSGAPVSTRRASTAPTSTVPTPKAPTSTAPARPDGAAVTVAPAALLDGLEALVRDVAAPARGTIQVIERNTGPGTDYDEPTSVTAFVTTAAGRFVVSASLPTNDGGVDSWQSGCADQGDACRELFATAKAGAWEWSPDNRPGEKIVRLKALGASGGAVLSVYVDNFISDADGKSTGPDWEAAGLSEASLRSAVDDYMASVGTSSSP
jgi:hypothetical protein